MLFVIGRRRSRSHSEKLWRDVSRRQGFMAAMKAVIIFKIIKFLMFMFVAVMIIAAVGAYIWFSN